MSTQPLPSDVLPHGVRSRFVDGVNGLSVHVLEAGHDEPGRPSVLLLHGFPELAYSWRRVLPALAAAGYHAIAPDQRGYGRTTGWDADYDGDLRSFRMLNLVRDAVGLLAALGIGRVGAVIGHDFGSPVAAWCALLRPDVFRSVVLMSAPFAGPPQLPLAGAPASDAAMRLREMNEQLAALRWPRQHYQWYYTTRRANGDMWRCEQGVQAFLRAYYHHKSADWKDNHPHPLRSWSASELAHMPTYYVMEHGQTMAQTVAVEMPSAAEIAACAWLTERELAVYGAEYQRTGFQGGLQWYRCAADAACISELQTFSGRTIDVPSLFVAGARDWGVFQKPGDFEAMQTRACTRMLGCELVDGAGHWVQQEQATAVNRLLLDFLQAAM
jgi:pimeloyl-ACP methyl ester carboxylesterase